MTKTASQTDGTGAQTSLARTWPDYVVAVMGSVVGAYLIGWQVVRWVAETQPGSLAFAVIGPILLVPLGSAVGTTLALALFRRHFPVLTGLLMLPVILAVGVVVVVLFRFIDTMGYGWLIITPPLVAPLGARFIVLGKKPPPSESRPPLHAIDWPIRRIIRYGLPVLLATLAGWLAINWLDGSGTDVDELAVPGPRVCGCELLTEWVEGRAISPRGEPFRASNLRITELPEGFVVVASQYAGDSVDADYYWTAFAEAGFTGVRLLDQPDHWSATFFEGDARSESQWTVDVALVDSQVEMTIRVRVEGSDWEIASMDQLWQPYTSNREVALEIQNERQARAVRLLEPVEQALRDIQEG